MKTESNRKRDYDNDDDEEEEEQEQEYNGYSNDDDEEEEQYRYKSEDQEHEQQEEEEEDSFEFRPYNAKLIKHALKIMTQFTPICNFDFSQEGISASMMDSGIITLVNCTIPAKCMYLYRVGKRRGGMRGAAADASSSSSGIDRCGVLGLQIQDTYTALKMTGDNTELCLRGRFGDSWMDIDTRDEMGVSCRNRVRLMDIEAERLYPNGYDESECCMFRIASSRFAKIVKSITQCSDTVVIELDETGVTFLSSEYGCGTEESGTATRTSSLSLTVSKRIHLPSTRQLMRMAEQQRLWVKLRSEALERGEELSQGELEQLRYNLEHPVLVDSSSLNTEQHAMKAVNSGGVWIDYYSKPTRVCLSSKYMNLFCNACNIADVVQITVQENFPARILFEFRKEYVVPPCNQGHARKTYHLSGAALKKAQELLKQHEQDSLPEAEAQRQQQEDLCVVNTPCENANITFYLAPQARDVEDQESLDFQDRYIEGTAAYNERMEETRKRLREEQENFYVSRSEKQQALEAAAAAAAEAASSAASVTTSKGSSAKTSKKRARETKTPIQEDDDDAPMDFDSFTSTTTATSSKRQKVKHEYLEDEEEEDDVDAVLSDLEVEKVSKKSRSSRSSGSSSRRKHGGGDDGSGHRHRRHHRRHHHRKSTSIEDE